MSRRMRRLLDRLRDWWQGEPGRHGYSYAINPPRLSEPGDRYRRCWRPELHNKTLHGANIDCPEAEHWTELEADQAEAQAELADNLADALLRSKYPHLFWPADRYWQARYMDLFQWSARQTAERNSFRRSWQLEPETMLDPPARLAAA